MTKHEPQAPETVGHFEQLLLTSIMMLGGETYGVPIYDKICELAEKRVNMGSMYLTLDRMEEKGLLSSWYSDPAKEPRGRPKRFYRLETAGLNALQESLETAKRLSEIFDDNSGGIRRWLKKRKPVRQST
jgi:DNA-binding PadR family transcriptional regulator